MLLSSRVRIRVRVMVIFCVSFLVVMHYFPLSLSLPHSATIARRLPRVTVRQRLQYFSAPLKLRPYGAI